MQRIGGEREPAGDAAWGTQPLNLRKTGWNRSFDSGTSLEADKVTMVTSAAKDALDTLIAFRRAHQRSFISNFNHCAWVEEQSWVFPAPAPKVEDVP